MTVIELLSHPIFYNFEIASGSRGLYNEVTGTGILDWESISDVDRTFMEGEFVVTTLSQAKDDPICAEHCLEMLIGKKVSAIAIKSIYYSEISKALKSISDLKSVPIFFFKDTYFDDIIYTIKDLLLSNILMASHTGKIDALFKSSPSSDKTIKLAKAINPFFGDRIICCFASLKESSIYEGRNIKEYYKDKTGTSNIQNFDSHEAIHSIIQYGNGILVVYTTKNTFVDLHKDFMGFLSELDFTTDNYILGLSSAYLNLENFGNSIKEGIYANISCLIDGKLISNFNEIGLDQLLMSISNEEPVRKYYCGLIDKLLTYDEINDLNLTSTLFEYVKCGGNIQLTSKNSFQHSNTIRYRVEKIKNILNIEESADWYSQLYIVTRLHQIYKHLDEF